ncbi:unnamed protein product [Allacma fusca]|uniref:Uncharacterized protein n=1 Tax=Allacma fusca TaxID=39272 RepID=A0A8J2PM23_9HEXA|nr:unnamed protein product [Allacma fusca]
MICDYVRVQCSNEMEALPMREGFFNVKNVQQKRQILSLFSDYYLDNKLGYRKMDNVTYIKQLVALVLLLLSIYGIIRIRDSVFTRNAQGGETDIEGTKRFKPDPSLAESFFKMWSEGVFNNKDMVAIYEAIEDGNGSINPENLLLLRDKAWTTSEINANDTTEATPEVVKVDKGIIMDNSTILRILQRRRRSDDISGPFSSEKENEHANQTLGKGIQRGSDAPAPTTIPTTTTTTTPKPATTTTPTTTTTKSIQRGVAVMPQIVIPPSTQECVKRKRNRPDKKTVCWSMNEFNKKMAKIRVEITDKVKPCPSTLPCKEWSTCLYLWPTGFVDNQLRINNKTEEHYFKILHEGIDQNVRDDIRSFQKECYEIYGLHQPFQASGSSSSGRRRREAKTQILTGLSNCRARILDVQECVGYGIYRVICNS